MTKLVAVFGHCLGWLDSQSGGIQARLAAVRHPLLGVEPTVTTSKVRRIEYADDGAVRELETQNTIYLRADYIPVESLGREHA